MSAIDKILGESGSHRTVQPSGVIVWRDARGEVHRVDGPAMEYPDGTRAWYRRGKFHRSGGPAYEDSKCEYWYKNGVLHRTDGPASTVSGHGSAYFVGGRRFTEEEFYRYVDQETGEVLLPPGKKLTHDSK